MTFAQSALRKTISLAAAIALAIPQSVLAGSFARTAPGLSGGGAPVVIKAPVSSMVDVKSRVAPVGLGLVSVTAAPVENPVQLAQYSAAPIPALAAIQRLEAAGVNLSGGKAQDGAQQLLAAAQTLPEGQAKQNIVAMAALMSAPTGGSQLPDGGAGSVFDNAKAQAANAGTPAAAQYTGLRALIPSFLRKKPTAASSTAAPAKSPADYEVPVEKLAYAPSPDHLPESTRDIAPIAENPNRPIVGQDVALRSLFYGLTMPGLHYNVFVSGPDGSGRETAARVMAKGLAATMKTPDDVVQVTNFMRKDSPLLLQLPAGKGPEFAKAVEGFIKAYQGSILGALNQKGAVAARKKIKETVENAIDESRAAFEAAVDGIRLPGDKFGIRIETQDHGDGTVGVNWALTVPKDGKMDVVKSEEEFKQLIADGVFTQAEWDQALKDAKAAAKPVIEQFAELQQAQNEMREQGNEQLQAVNAKVAQGLVQQIGRPVMAAAGKNRHDTPAHKEFEKEAARKSEAFEKAMAEGVRFADKYTIVFQQVGQQMGVALAKIVDGQLVPVDQEELERLMSEGVITQEAIQAAVEPWLEKFQALQEELAEAHKKVHENDEPVSDQEREAMQYVGLMLSHAAANYSLFLPSEESSEQQQRKADPSEIYQANLLVTNTPDKNGNGAPVVEVKDYSFDGIFGSADGNKKLMLLPNGAAVKVDGPGGASFKSGSLQQAQGGFWIADALELLKSPGVWPALMAAARTGQVEIVEEGLLGLASLRGARYRVPGQTKIVLVGSPMIRMLLQHYDQDFMLNFPQMSTAEFEPSLPATAATIEGWLEFFGKVVRESAGSIMHHTRDAMSQILKFASKLSGSNEKLTAQFGMSYSLMREATHMARLNKRDEVTGADVEAALAARALSAGVYVRHHQELFNKGTFKIETDGAVVGQGNGLAVIGDDRGVVMRITAEAVPREPGDPILVSLDKNSGEDMTGSSFRKSLGVVETSLRKAFGWKRSLPLSLRVSFEQNYGGIDGDSATSTMEYIAISAIAGVPLKQQYAYTGSADQRNWVQPIGGVNAKIAGFFDVASARGLTGTQGVIIPKTNESELNLRQDIIDAIKAGKFHVYSVSGIEEAMEILTGVPWETIKAKAIANLEQAERDLRAGPKGK